MKKTKRIGALLLAMTLAFANVFAQSGILSQAADTNEMSISYYGITSNLIELTGTMADGKAVGDIYGTWKSAFSTVKLGARQSDGSIQYNDMANVAWSIGTNAIGRITFYGLQIDTFDALQIDAGTELSIGQGANSMTPIAITNSLRLVKNEQGMWENKSAELETTPPTDLTLSFQSVNGGNNWYFRGANTNGTYYKVPVIVDGTAQNMIMESDKAGTFSVWDGFFSALQGAEPTSTVTFEKGAVIKEIQVVNDAWEEVANASQYVLTDSLELKKTDGVWGVKSNVEYSALSLGAYSWGGGSDGVIGIQIGNLLELQKAAWYSSIVTATNTSWGKASGTVTVGSESKSVDIQFPGNGEVFIYYDPAKITDSFVISTDTVFTPIAGTANEGKYTVQFTQDYAVNVVEKIIGEPEQQVEYQALDPATLSVQAYADQTGQNRSYITLLANQELLPSGAEWWNNYDAVEATVLIDGREHVVAFGGGGASNFLAMYFPWDEGESNILENAEEIVIQKSSKMNVGLSGLQFEDDLKLVKKYGVWMTQAAANDFEETTVSLGAYSWGGGSDGVIGIQIGNLSELQKAAWYQAIETANGSSWGKVSGMVTVGSESKSVDIQFPGNGEVFIYYNPAEITDSFVISKDTVFTPMSGTANAGTYNIRFTQDYGVNIEENLIGEPGIQVEYRTLDVTKFSVQGFTDQTEQNRSYMMFLTDEELLPSGAEWWNNYDTANATVLIDGKAHAVAFGGGGASNILAMYFPWDEGESNILESADKIVIKQDAMMSVGLEGLKTNKDLTLSRVGTIWISEYTQEEENEGIPTNALKVNVKFGQITGQNILGVSAILSDGRKLLDIYGDWTTAYGSIKLGVLDENGKTVYTTMESTIYSISDQVYLSAVDLSLYDAILIEADTVLYPDASCKSDRPIVLANAFAMVRDADDEWEVISEFKDGSQSETTTQNFVSDTTATNSDEETTSESAAADVKEEEYDGTTMIHKQYIDDNTDADVVADASEDIQIVVIIASAVLGVLVLVLLVLLIVYRKKRQEA